MVMGRWNIFFPFRLIVLIQRYSRYHAIGIPQYPPWRSQTGLRIRLSGGWSFLAQKWCPQVVSTGLYMYQKPTFENYKPTLLEPKLGHNCLGLFFLADAASIDHCPSPLLRFWSRIPVKLPWAHRLPPLSTGSPRDIEGRPMHEFQAGVGGTILVVLDPLVKQQLAIEHGH